MIATILTVVRNVGVVLLLAVLVIAIMSYRSRRFRAKLSTLATKAKGLDWKGIWKYSSWFVVPVAAIAGAMLFLDTLADLVPAFRHFPRHFEREEWMSYFKAQWWAMLFSGFGWLMYWNWYQEAKGSVLHKHAEAWIHLLGWGLAIFAILGGVSNGCDGCHEVAKKHNVAMDKEAGLPKPVAEWEREHFRQQCPEPQVGDVYEIPKAGLKEFCDTLPAGASCLNAWQKVAMARAGFCTFDREPETAHMVLFRNPGDTDADLDQRTFELNAQSMSAVAEANKLRAQSGQKRLVISHWAVKSLGPADWDSWVRKIIATP